MKKRIISLVLVVAMLLCVLPAASAAENEGPAFSSYYLSLNKSIAINFKLSNYDGQNFDKVVFEKDGEAVQTITKLPAAGADGKYTFTFTKLSPAELGKFITAKLYLTTGDTVVAEKTRSALQYCNTILAGEYSSNLKNLVVDLLNFGAEFQKYKNITEGLVNADLGENTKWATIAAPTLVSDTVNNSQGAITEAGLALNDSVEIFFVAADNVAKLEVTVGDKAPYTVTASDNGRFYFDKLNPAQMREKVIVQAYDSSNVPVGGTLTYSIVSYAEDPDPSATDVTLAMMKYGDAAAAYVASTASDVLYYNNFNYAASGATATGTYTINSDGQFEAVASTTNPDPFQINFANSKQKISVEWDFKSTLGGDIKSFRSGMTFMVGNSVLWLPIDAYTFKVVDKAGETSTNVSWTDNKTYKMKVELDTVNDTYNYYIGDELKASGTLRRDITYCTNFGLDTGSFNGNSTLTVYIDNLVVKQIP